MRLFVAAWPTQELADTISRARFGPSGSDLRWVAPQNWHATLSFLGLVPDHERDELVTSLAGIGSTTSPAAGELGPATVALGGRLLYVPVSGLGELAHAVREATRPFNRSPDRDEPFLGHLTLARVRRGRRIPRTAVGIPLSSPWPVREFRLVSSTTGADGAQYMPVAHVTLKG